MLLLLIIQIITESLPISSSAHVILFAQLFQINIHQLSESFEAISHISALAIILFFFITRWFKLLYKTNNNSAYNFVDTTISILKFIIIADSITAATWLCIPKTLPPIYTTIGLMITAIVLWLSRYNNEPKNNKELSNKDAIILGIAQSISLVPGISRFAMTYYVACQLGYQRLYAFALSFMIQAPLIFAAIAKGFMLHFTDINFALNHFDTISVSILVVATCISLMLMKLMEQLIAKNELYYISFYMIIPIIGSILYL